MNALVTAASILSLTVACAAQQPATGSNDTMSQLSRSAEQELATSIQELNKLRELIATEKLPLAQDLTALEEKLSRLRREHDAITRSVDEGKLKLNTIKT